MVSSNSFDAVLPSNGETAFLLIGHLQRPHGIQGEIAMQVLTDFPERIKKGKKVWVGPNFLEFTIQSLRWKQNLLLLRFNQAPDRKAIEALVNLDVYVREDSLAELPEGRYYFYQLIGLDVYEEQRLVGQIKEILVTGANDVFVILQPDGKELLLPDIKSVILGVDLDAQRMQVKIPEGLA